MSLIHWGYQKVVSKLTDLYMHSLSIRNTLIRNNLSNFSIIRHDVLTNREWIIKMFVIFFKRCQKADGLIKPNSNQTIVMF